MMRYSEKKRVMSIVIVLLSLAIVGGLIFSPESRFRRSSRGRILETEPEGIESVEIDSPSETLIFRRFGGEWIQADGSRRLPARSERVEAYLEAVRAVRFLQIASGTETSWKGLGLDEPSACRVRLAGKDGRSLADFYVGRYSPDASRTYIRKSGDRKSYAVDSSVASRLPEGRTSWLDLRIFGESVPTEDIQRLRVSGTLRFRDGSSYAADFVLTQSLSKGWTSSEIPDVDPSAADRFVRSLMNLEASDFAAETVLPEGDDGLRLTMELGGGGLKTLRVIGGAAGGTTFLSSMTGTGRVLVVEDWTLKSALKLPEELRRKKYP